MIFKWWLIVPVSGRSNDDFNQQYVPVSWRAMVINQWYVSVKLWSIKYTCLPNDDQLPEDGSVIFLIGTCCLQSYVRELSSRVESPELLTKSDKCYLSLNHRRMQQPFQSIMGTKQQTFSAIASSRVSRWKKCSNRYNYYYYYYTTTITMQLYTITTIQLLLRTILTLRLISDWKGYRL